MLKSLQIKFAILVFLILFSLTTIQAQNTEEILIDRNADGIVSVGCFGDSITYGVGDGTNPGEFVLFSPLTDGNQGYPRRIQALSGLATKNFGVPSERFLEGGMARLPGVLADHGSDLMIIFEGANDAILRVSSDAYARSIQKAINMTRAEGALPILATIPSPCCSRAGRELYTQEYGSVMRERAEINQIPVVDLELAWRTTCVDKEECELFNIPDGIHPNKKGYDVVAQTILATLYGIDIFSPGGAAELEGALGLTPGSVIVKPRQVVAPVQE